MDSRFATLWSRLRGRENWAALGLSLALWLVYQSNARFIAGSDVYPARFIPVSLVTEGDYDLDEFTFIRDQGKYGVPGGNLFSEPGAPYDNRVLSYSPTYVPTLIAPFYWIPFGLFHVSPRHFLVFYMDKAFAALFVALSAAWLFKALREVLTPVGWALSITLAYGLGTSAWAISSQSLWQHGPSQFFLALSLWLWLRADRTGRGWIWLGWATASAVASRPSDIFWAGLVGLDLLSRRRWKAVAGLMAGAFPPAIFLTTYNWVIFGNPLTSGYSFLPVNWSPDFLNWKNLPAGALGLFFSPSLGLLPNAPFYAFLPLSLWIGLRSPVARLSRRRTLLPLAFVLAHGTLYGCYLEWWAGWSFAYRYLTDSLPFLSFLLANLGRLRRFKVTVWATFSLLALWGAAIQAHGAYVWMGHWFRPNWTDLKQPLRLQLRDGPSGTIFDRPSAVWSLSRDKHLIGHELQYFRWDPGLWFTTPTKVYRDLFLTRHIPYGYYPPIILPIGHSG